MSIVRNFRNIITLISIASLFTLCASAELKKHKKVRCHPSCCPKPKQPKSLIGRYVLDIADGLDEDGDNFFDLVYVLMKVAKGTYNEFTAGNPIGTDETRKHANESIFQEYRYNEDNMIPTNPISYDMLDATKRSAVRTRYAPGNGIASNTGFGGSGIQGTAGRTGFSLFRGLSPQFNFDKNRFLGLNVSTQAAMAVSIIYLQIQKIVQ